MSMCKWTNEVERFADGEASDTPTVEAHLATCAACSQHHATLLRFRTSLAALPAAPVLSDEQFTAFMSGIETELSQKRRRPGGFWALMSLSAAALLIALATFSVFTGPGPVRANEVESVSTQIDGATVHWDNSDDGVTTIWISIGEDDV